MKIIPSTRVTAARLAITLLTAALLLSLGLLVVSGMRAHARELALQVELGKLQKRLSQKLDEAEYREVEIDGCTYYMTLVPMTHAATCTSPIHKGNQ